MLSSVPTAGLGPRSSKPAMLEQWIVRIAVAVGCIATACDGSAGARPTLIPVDPCRAAWVEFAAIESNLRTEADLYPAVRACQSIDSWKAAFDGAGFTGTATSLLANVCLNPEVSREHLCDLVSR